MFNLHDLYATDVVAIRCNSNTVHSFVIRFAPQVATEICFTVRVWLKNSLMKFYVKVQGDKYEIRVKVKIKLKYASL